MDEHVRDTLRQPRSTSDPVAALMRHGSALWRYDHAVGLNEIGG
jgi:hypothetical protein